jgi:hypothetical protein
LGEARNGILAEGMTSKTGFTLHFNVCEIYFSVSFDLILLVHTVKKEQTVKTTSRISGHAVHI